MRQFSFLPKTKYEHGGFWALGSRRSKRPVDIKRPIHVVLRSDLARGNRSLRKNELVVIRALEKYGQRFRVRVYERAVCGNHIHLFLKAKTKKDLQNFFRVFAGQVAQEILRRYPLQKGEAKAFSGLRGGTPMHRKNQRTFWSLVVYSRLASWGREFKDVSKYVLQNAREAAGLVAYKKTKARIAAAMRAVPLDMLIFGQQVNSS